MRRPLVVLGLTLLGLAAVTPVRAAEDPGSGLGVFSLAATAPAVRIGASDPSTCYATAAADNGCQGAVPQAVSTLRNGPIGHGLAAVAWPGGIAAGAGSLLITAGGSGVPPQAALLNDPVRADAYTNVGQPTQSYDAVPGTSMTATALPALVTAHAAVDSSAALAAVSTGSSKATSKVALTGVKQAVAVAHSEVRDVTIAGVLHIASLTSDATATTDGTTARSSGATTASGVTVGSVAVSVDGTGVHALGQGADTVAEQAAVNAVLNGAGVTVRMGPAQGKPTGGAVDYAAQSLVVVIDNPTGFTVTVALGGARASVAATPAFGVPAPATLPTTGAVQPPPVGVPPAQGSQPQVSRPLPPQTGTVPAPQAAGPDAVPVLAAAAPPDPGPVRTRLVLLVLGGGLLLAGLMRRLPDEVLRERPIECRGTS